MLERFPYDYDSLRKGDYLSEATITSYLPQAKALPEAEYQLMLLNERRRIEQAFLERGELVYIKIEGRGLRVLTDAEASTYIAKEQRRHRRGMKKNLMILSHVDVRNLSTTERREHEHRLAVESRYVQAQERVQRTEIDEPKPHPPGRWRFPFLVAGGPAQPQEPTS